MANTTARSAKHIHGTNPQFLVEKVIRSRIYDSPYWKEHCFGLTATSWIDRTLKDVRYVGGTFGLQKPTPFLCLLLKLLQIQPDRDIVLEYLRYPEFKYLRALAAMYVRLTFRAVEVFEVLEPLLNDFGKLRVRQMNGQYAMSHMDEFIDQLLTEERVCELILPRLAKRDVLEEVEGLAPRISKLEDGLLAGNGDRAEDSNAASDDSAQAERREKRRRIERAQRIRKTLEEDQERRRRIMLSDPSNGAKEDQADSSGYSSQEVSDDERFVSRSPSRSRSGSIEGTPSRSRSPSRSPDRTSADGYKSRSVSRSPDRI